MTLFVDTSAFYALLDERDAHHERAVRAWCLAETRFGAVWTSNYVLVETCALLQSRLGMSAVRRFEDAILLPVEVYWVPEEVHRTASAMHRAADLGRLSLVDCSSFEVMRRRGIRHVFCFDKHFERRGFEILP